MNPDNYILEYVHNGKGQLVGAVIGTKINDRIVIGWSKFNKKQETGRFSKLDAFNIAMDRTKMKKVASHIIPAQIERRIKRFTPRCQKYFRCADVIVSTCNVDHN